MGAYYFYCNLDKLEFISIGLCGGAIKHDGIGRGPTARLLARLLVPASVGRGGPLNWAGARLAVLADDHAVPADIGLPPEFLLYDCVGDLLRAELKDVSDDALRLMSGLEPGELEEAARGDRSVFAALGRLADGGDREMKAWLRRRFGKDWRSAYGQLLR